MEAKLPSNKKFPKIKFSLANLLGDKLLAAKTHFSKGKRMYLEVVFKKESQQQFYATEGLNIFKQTIFGYILINLKRSFLSVKLRNTPFGDMN
ncbi:10751_t:CDS:2 [Scutellospora calospora]|uniref:10751_t:CDS:1 n=1 Tax=Scutellospora calospora TaxID=85575 RepID=A0ACA9KG57_9GLOM|nr:10751_t:CDS:2 [Scutellospora calospora]